MNVFFSTIAMATEGPIQETPALILPSELTCYTHFLYTLLYSQAFVPGLTHREQAQDKSQKFIENFFLGSQKINQASERKDQS